MFLSKDDAMKYCYIFASTLIINANCFSLKLGCSAVQL